MIKLENIKKLIEYLKIPSMQVSSTGQSLIITLFNKALYFLMFILPLFMAFTAQLFLANTKKELFKHYSVACIPYIRTYFQNYSMQESYMIGIVLYIISIILLIIFYRRLSLPGNNSKNLFKSFKTPEKFLKSKNIKIISVIVFVLSYGVLFYCTYVQNIYNTYLLLSLWLLAILACIVLLFFVDCNEKLFRFLHLSGKEKIFVIMLILFVCVTGIPYLEKIPLLMHVDQFGITMESLKMLDRFDKLQVFSHVASWSSPYIGFMPTVFFIKIFGSHNSFGFRFTSVFFAILMVPVFYLLVRNAVNKRVAEVAVLILLMTQFMLYYERAHYFVVQVAFIVMLSLLFLVLSLKNNSLLYAFLSGGTASLTLYHWGGGTVIIPIVAIYFVYLFIRYSSFKKPLLKKLFVFIVSFMIVVSPLFFTSWANNSFIALDEGFKLSTKLSCVFKKGPSCLVNNMDKNFTKDVLVNNLTDPFKKLLTTPDSSTFYNLKNPILSLYLAVFFILSFFLLLSRPKNPFIVLFLLTIVMTLFCGGVLTNAADSKRLFVCLPYVVVLASIFLIVIARTFAGFLFSKIWRQIAFKSVFYILFFLITFTNMKIFYVHYVEKNIIERSYLLEYTVIQIIDYFSGKYNLYTPDNIWPRIKDNWFDRHYIHHINIKYGPYLYYLKNPENVQVAYIDKNKLPVTRKQDKDVMFVLNAKTHYYAINILLHHYGNGELFLIPYNERNGFVSLLYVPKETINQKLEK